MSKIDQEWATFSDARKQEEVRHRGDRVNVSLLGGIQWLTLVVLFFVTLGAMGSPTPDQAALRQFSVVLLLVVGLAAVAASLLSERDYRRLLNKL